MAAYARFLIGEFLSADTAAVVGTLQTRYAHDGFSSQYTQQTKAWARFVPLVQGELSELVASFPAAAAWGILLEYPLYRLRKRIDAVILAADTIIVLEAKVGASEFSREDERQVEGYALDLRDFHAGSAGFPLVPILWCTDAASPVPDLTGPDEIVADVQNVGAGGLGTVLRRLALSTGSSSRLVLDEWARLRIGRFRPSSRPQLTSSRATT